MFPTWVTGLVTAGGQPCANATVRSSIGISVVTLDNGYYLMVHPAGTFDLTATSTGYGEVTKPRVVMPAGCVVTVSFNM